MCVICIRILIYYIKGTNGIIILIISVGFLFGLLVGICLMCISYKKYSNYNDNIKHLNELQKISKVLHDVVTKQNDNNIISNDNIEFNINNIINDNRNDISDISYSNHNITTKIISSGKDTISSDDSWIKEVQSKYDET